MPKAMSLSPYSTVFNQSQTDFFKTSFPRRGASSPKDFEGLVWTQTTRKKVTKVKKKNPLVGLKVAKEVALPRESSFL